MSWLLLDQTLIVVAIVVLHRLGRVPGKGAGFAALSRLLPRPSRLSLGLSFPARAAQSSLPAS